MPLDETGLRPGTLFFSDVDLTDFDFDPLLCLERDLFLRFLFFLVDGFFNGAKSRVRLEYERQERNENDIAPYQINGFQ